MPDKIIASTNTQTAPAAESSQAFLFKNEEQPGNKKRPSPFAIQQKLTVGAPDDPLEHEANNVANKVMRMPGTSFIQRKCEACANEENLQLKPLSERITPLIQRKSGVNARVSDMVEQLIHSSKGRGSSMDGATQSFMESRLGAGLSNVRIHDGANAAVMSKELNARAFTVGSDIYFNDGQYSPASFDGRRLVAHELVHTLQQTSNNNNQVQKQPVTIPEVTVVGDPHFYDRALRSNRYYQQHATIPGWPYLAQLRTLWEAHSYDDFADAVSEYQRSVMHSDTGDGMLGPITAAAMSVPSAASGGAPPSTATAITLQGVRADADWLERRVAGVGIFGWGGPFRLDLEVNAQGFPTRSIFLQRSSVSLGADPFANRMEIQMANQIYGSQALADHAVRDFPFARPDATVYAFYRGPENIIFPTIISETTAPHLMRVLRLAIRQEGDDARAASGLLIQSFLLAAGLRAAGPVAAGGASAAPRTAAGGTGATAVASGAVSTLRTFFGNLLRTRSAGSITVEGVQFGNVRAVSEAGNVLRITRTSIENLGRVPGQGRTMAEAFEQAAVQLGRDTGATSVRVSVETVVNPQWMAQLRSMGYEMETITTLTETGAFQSLQNVWTRVFTL